MYHADDIIDVYYEGNQPFFKWRGGVLEPVVLDTNEFFVSDMYAKLRFVDRKATGQYYLSIIPKDNPDSIRYDYLKVDSDYKTPSMHLKAGNYLEAQAGFLAIQSQDSLSPLINEREFNRMGYGFLRDQNYEDAIGIFKINVALYPDSDNVYDSLADAYLRSGDSAKAYVHYSKAYDLNPQNKRAKEYMDAYAMQ